MNVDYCNSAYSFRAFVKCNNAGRKVIDICTAEKTCSGGIKSGGKYDADFD